MEIKNNPVICPKCGSYYNPAVHAVCPVCGQGPAAEIGATVPVDGVESIPTGPVDGGGGIGSFAKTEAPGVVRNAAAGSSPFQPTMIGGDLGVDGGAEPVVGWLVCVEGPARGTDYRLHAGYNYIGREMGDVRIGGDQQISRQNHAMIAFDDTELVYYVGPSAGRNLIKVNGKTVLNAVELNNYDTISIGTTSLIFVALCGEHFSWKKG